VKIVALIKKVSIVVIVIVELMALQLILSSCGFQPRGSGYESIVGQEVTIVSADPHGPLERKVKAALKATGVEFSSSSSEVEGGNSANIIQILQQQLTRKVISVDENGRPAEYENIITLDVIYIFHDGTKLNRQLSTRRDYLYDNSNTLAYDREEVTVLSEMREELSHRLVSNYLRELSGKVNP